MDSQPKNYSFLKFLAFILILVVCWIIGKQVGFDVEKYEESLLNFPLFISGPLFVIIYVVSTFFILFGPKDVLRISSAILFGPIVSTVFVSIAEMINACVLFTLSRSLGREWVARKLGRSSENVDEGKKDTGFLGVLALRVNPLIPFRIMDLGYGLTRISLKKYFIAVLIGTVPRVYWLQTIIAGVGKNIFKDLSAIQNYLLDNPQVITYSAVYFLGVIVLTIVAVVAKFFKKKTQNNVE